MAPEQAGGRSDEISKLTDVYALGVILYAALCGHPPHQADNPLNTLKLIVDSDPVPPRQWNPGLPKDLETICLTCLNRKPAQRYSSAQMLAEELARFQEGKPILARPRRAIDTALAVGPSQSRHSGADGILFFAIGCRRFDSIRTGSAFRQAACSRDSTVRARPNSELYRNQISLADSEIKFGNTDSAQRIFGGLYRGWTGLGVELPGKDNAPQSAQFVREPIDPVVGVAVSRIGWSIRSIDTEWIG